MTREKVVLPMNITIVAPPVVARFAEMSILLIVQAAVVTEVSEIKVLVFTLEAFNFVYPVPKAELINLAQLYSYFLPADHGHVDPLPIALSVFAGLFLLVSTLMIAVLVQRKCSKSQCQVPGNACLTHILSMYLMPCDTPS